MLQCYTMRPYHALAPVNLYMTKTSQIDNRIQEIEQIRMKTGPARQRIDLSINSIDRFDTLYLSCT